MVAWVFGAKRSFAKKSEADGYCRANLVVAKQCFDRLVGEIRGSNARVRFADLMRYEKILRDYVFDLKPVAEYLERQKNADYVFFRGAKSYHVHTWEVFLLSRQLAIQSVFKNSGVSMDHKTAQIASVFVLRQALEAKFLRLIGVEIFDRNGDTPKLRHLFHYEFIVKHLPYFNFKAVAFADLKKIYGWCNDVVHRVYQPLAWEIEYGQAICGGLFNSQRTQPAVGWSINNAVEIVNRDQMQGEFMEHFSKSYDHGMWGLAVFDPEAVCV